MNIIEVVGKVLSFARAFLLGGRDEKKPEPTAPSRPRSRSRDWKRRAAKAESGRRVAKSEKKGKFNKEHQCAKPDYKALARGTVVLVDGANVLAAFTPDEAAGVLRSLVKGLKEHGHMARIYLEHRAWKYFSCNQKNSAARNDFMTACDELGVTIVTGESDLAILQALETVSGAVAITNDRYRDYAKTYPNIVGTPRLRRFCVAKIGERDYISVDGLVKAIAVSDSTEAKAQPQREVVEAVPQADSTPGTRSYGKNMVGGLCGHAAVLMEKGQVHGAAHCFEKIVAHKKSEGFAGLADVCDWAGDAKGAARFAELGERLERRKRDQAIRNRRIAAERRRIGSMCYAKCA